MAALTALMTRFCAGEDSWLAHRSNSTSDPGTSEARDGNGKPRHNKNKRRSNNEGTQDIRVNVGFSGSKTGQRKKPFKANRDGPSSLDKILDRPCQIHGAPTNPPTIPTKIVGFSNKPASSMSNTKGRGRLVTVKKRRLAYRAPGDRSNFPPK